MALRTLLRRRKRFHTPVDVRLKTIWRKNHASKRSTCSRLDKEALGWNRHQRPAGAVPALGRRHEVGKTAVRRRDNGSARISRERYSRPRDRPDRLHDHLRDPAHRCSGRDLADRLPRRRSRYTRARRQWAVYDIIAGTCWRIAMGQTFYI